VDHRFLFLNLLLTIDTLFGIKARVSCPVFRVDPYQ
jgi:hypothetical protein